MNCNTFSDELCFRLTGVHAPAWINRLAGIAVALHCLLPQGWLPPLRPPSVVPSAVAGGRDEEVQVLLDPLEHPHQSDFVSGSSSSGGGMRPARSAPQLVT